MSSPLVDYSTPLEDRTNIVDVVGGSARLMLYIQSACTGRMLQTQMSLTTGIDLAGKVNADAYLARDIALHRNHDIGCDSCLSQLQAWANVIRTSSEDEHGVEVSTLLPHSSFRLINQLLQTSYALSMSGVRPQLPLALPSCTSTFTTQR